MVFQLITSLTLLALVASVWVLALRFRRLNKDINTEKTARKLAVREAVTAATLQNEGLKNDVDEIRKRVEALEGGTVPDYEQAKAAAEAVNNFNRGLSGIMGFDPYEVLQKKREGRVD